MYSSVGWGTLENLADRLFTFAHSQDMRGKTRPEKREWKTIVKTDARG